MCRGRGCEEHLRNRVESIADSEQFRIRQTTIPDQSSALFEVKSSDLVDDHGFTAKYASVKRFVAKLRGTARPEARVVITTAPGEEGQVDYGEGPMVRWPATGKYRRTRLFVLTLGYSRKAVRLLVWQSSTQVWAELHERAFRRLGGTVRVIVLDNLKEGVLTPDIYDPALNPLYRDVLAHYGVVALPCRVGDTAAVTALLDRLLHHAHVLKCGPRSWRTKVQTDLRTDEGTK